MKTLITGSSGHLGEGIARTLTDAGRNFVGIDVKPGPLTSFVGSIADADFVRDAMRDVDTVFHTATLHKPHVETHSIQDFIDTNITGTNNLLEAARTENVRSFVFTSTTSSFGDAMKPGDGDPAVWVTEELTPVPKNIYGVTKLAAEDLCRLYHRRYDMNVLVLKTSRFFPEEDDNRENRDGWSQENVKANEFLFRRVELADCVEAHLRAVEKAPDIGFGKYIISATPPFNREDATMLRTDPASVVRRYFPEYERTYQTLGWKMFDSIERVYDNAAARQALGWEPEFTFAEIIRRLNANEDTRSPLAAAVGKKAYHDKDFADTDGPYPVNQS